MQGRVTQCSRSCRGALSHVPAPGIWGHLHISGAGDHGGRRIWGIRKVPPHFKWHPFTASLVTKTDSRGLLNALLSQLPETNWGSISGLKYKVSDLVFCSGNSAPLKSDNSIEDAATTENVADAMKCSRRLGKREKESSWQRNEVSSHGDGGNWAGHWMLVLSRKINND